jgi:hypothetical protein
MTPFPGFVFFVEAYLVAKINLDKFQKEQEAVIFFMMTILVQYYLFYGAQTYMFYIGTEQDGSQCVMI